ncbi:Hint domain-containing protein [Paenibacillus alvei]|uniref:Hint domain-containing protein n=1 Tax=Paenibacillus alvei TaxID=44250 RepID=UPI002AA2AC3C|nr:Hint domain-containing protein [Paenibacillus alvei]
MNKRPSNKNKPSAKDGKNSGCNCFTAGTKIQTDDGEKNIEDIEVGDLVLAKDENNPDGELAEVTGLYRNQRDI